MFDANTIGMPNPVANIIADAIDRAARSAVDDAIDASDITAAARDAVIGSIDIADIADDVTDAVDIDAIRDMVVDDIDVDAIASDVVDAIDITDIASDVRAAVDITDVADDVAETIDVRGIVDDHMSDVVDAMDAAIESRPTWTDMSHAIAHAIATDRANRSIRARAARVIARVRAAIGR